MMINKMQTKEDIEAFRMIAAGDIEDIVRDSPEHLVNIIADILLTFLLKINVPVSEAENLTDKVREKNMAELFENMEKLDIQAERRNTEEQRQRAETAEQKAETSIALLIESYQQAGTPKDEVLKKLTDIIELNEAEAKLKIEQYWNYSFFVALDSTVE